LRADRLNIPNELATNDSKGCGGVMRVSPVGLIVSRVGADGSPQEAFRLGC
jgi:ADP-ribosylglycohydrolase